MLSRSCSGLVLGSVKPVVAEADSIPGLCKCVQLLPRDFEVEKRPKNKIVRRIRSSSSVVVVDRLQREKSYSYGRKTEEETRKLGFELGSGGGVNGGDRGGGFGGEKKFGGGADSNSTDVYYQKMLEANPENSLLLRNYAKFLHEVQGDLEKGEEYYERAILANPSDGEVLSLYAKLLWEARKDAPRAEAYFDQALQANPDDCYVLGSYAHFLWNSEEDEEENHAPQTQQNIGNPVLHQSAMAEAT